MRKKYRIKTTIELEEVAPLYIVQVRTWIGLWIDVKNFYDPYDPDFAKSEAEELLDKLNEK